MIEIEKIVITSEMVSLIGEIDEFKGSWQQLSRIAPDRLKMLKKVATIESIGSSTRIEGCKLSNHEVEALLGHLEADSFQDRDEQEIAGYSLACANVCDHFDFIPVSENAIKQMHTWLLQYSDKDENHRGEYKKVPIRIEAFDSEGKSLGIVFETASPMETPVKMNDLVSWTKSALEEKILHPLIVIGLFTVVFLAIHPFQDGNGRLSRLLTSWLMLKCKYLYAPYSSLESVIEANKESYYLALQKTQKSWQEKRPDWTPWLLFFFRCLQRQKQHLEVKISREQLLQKNQPLLFTRILEQLEAHGRLKIGELEALITVNRNTLKKSLATLVRDGQIKLHGKGKGSWYTLFLEGESGKGGVGR